MFSHEASFATPLIAAQVANGIRQAQLRIAGPPRGPSPAAAPTAASGSGRLLTLDALQKSPIAGGAVDLCKRTGRRACERVNSRQEQEILCE